MRRAVVDIKELHLNEIITAKQHVPKQVGITGMETSLPPEFSPFKLMLFLNITQFDLWTSCVVIQITILRNSNKFMDLQNTGSWEELIFAKPNFH